MRPGTDGFAVRPGPQGPVRVRDRDVSAKISMAER